MKPSNDRARLPSRHRAPSTKRRYAFLFSTCVAFSGTFACDNKPEEPRSQVDSKSTVSSKSDELLHASPAVDVVEPKGDFRLPGAERVVAIGDLHGDFSSTEKAFRLAGAIDDKGKWSGGELVVVQTGDQLDRGAEEREIIEFLKRLEKEASEAGGRLIVLNGNHEAMNVLGDFRYVAAGAMNSFSEFEPPSPLSVQVEGLSKSRASAFLPGGGAARILADRRLIVMVGDTVFVHGGVTTKHLDYGIDKLNRESKAWMLGETTLPPRPVVDQEGPLWTRIYGDPVLSPEACRMLERTLKRLGAKRMAVGHTVQERGMSAACDDRVFRIDVGLAAAYGDRPIQVLEIKKGAAKILTAP